MNPFIKYLAVFLLLFCTPLSVTASQFGKIETLPLSERWYGIYVNNERVGFYRQQIEKREDGYQIDGKGSVRMKVMTFSKIASMRESYQVSKNLTLQTFDAEQTVNGLASHINGKVSGGTLQIKSDVAGKITDKTLRFKGDLYPSAILNFYPLMKSVASGTSYKIQAFDPEELKIKEVKITVLGEGKTEEGQPALKLRNNLYPFVTNDIWVDGEGNTLLESVRDGLVMTKSEQPEVISSFISNWALAKQDLIYDFSLVRTAGPIKEPEKLKGLSVELINWNDSLTTLQGGGQQVYKNGQGRVIFKTGKLANNSFDTALTMPLDAELESADKIEADAPEIMAQVKLLSAGIKNNEELAKAMASWTADWLKDTIDDGGGALESFKSRKGNCQTHARLYTALARGGKIPTKFVSGLVYLAGKGFLYHSWAESFINGQWVSVDPTYNQIPADPTHIKLFEGHLPEDMMPIITIIGRIRMNVLETAY